MSNIYNSDGTLADLGFHDQSYYEGVTRAALTGKVIIALGDSYTVGMSTQLSAIATKYGMVIDNRGVVSATVAWRSTDSNRRMYNTANTIVSDYTNGKTISSNTYYASDVGIVLFMGGANDGNGISAWIGTGIHETDKSTIYGSLNHIFSQFLTTFTNAKIICTTQPSFYSLTVSSVATDAEAQEQGFDDLAELQTMTDIQYSNYCMAMKESAIKNIAWAYGIPVNDMFTNFPSVFVASNRSTYWQSDKLHLTTAGYNLVSSSIDAKIVEVIAKC